MPREAPSEVISSDELSKCKTCVVHVQDGREIAVDSTQHLCCPFTGLLRWRDFNASFPLDHNTDFPFSWAFSFLEFASWLDIEMLWGLAG